MTLQTFLLGLLISSSLTSLATEGIKKILTEKKKNYYANTLAGVVSLVISAAIGVCYVLVNNLSFTAPVIITIVALIFMSWLCAMVGYDKVIQAISQFKVTGKE